MRRDIAVQGNAIDLSTWRCRRRHFRSWPLGPARIILQRYLRLSFLKYLSVAATMLSIDFKPAVTNSQFQIIAMMWEDNPCELSIIDKKRLIEVSHLAIIINKNNNLT